MNTSNISSGPVSKFVEHDYALSNVKHELKRARAKFGAFNSAHEGYAILLEELDELWAHVKTNQSKRDLELMYHEAIQVAAMAVCFAAEVCSEERGRV